MKPDYRFFLTINGGQRKSVKPNYPDDLSLDYERETGQRFFRARLSSKLTFMREDYDLIMAAAFDSVYLVIIQKSDDMGLTWSDYYTGKFVRTDCTIDTDDGLIMVQPETYDQYSDVLAGLDKEYDLIKLSPANQRIGYQRRPVLQVYALGDTILSSFLSGMYWEQDCEAQSPWDADYLINTCHFALNTILRELNLSGDFSDANAFYSGQITLGGEFYGGSLYPETANGYRVDVVIQYTEDHKRADYTLVRISDNAALYSFSENATPLAVSGEFDMTPVSGSGMTGQMHAKFTGYVMFARYILDVEEIAGLPTFEILTTDMITDNKNYHRCIGYSIPIAQISNNLTWNVTEWGQNPLGQYYLPPNQTEAFFPLARSRWQTYSIWFKYYALDNILEEAGRADAVIRDAFPIASCISVLLGQFSSITFGESTEYSQFLYGSVNPVSGMSFRLFMSQKSNITAGEYTIPAQKAPCTLGTILNMLKNVYQCYWHIESGKLRIEHISWYKNGGSYSGNQSVGIDLTALINTRNGKTLSFCQNEYTFEKEDMPERYQFSWMDDCTDAFDGQPIQVLSRYVKEGKIEEITISDFTADIDLMLLYPAGISVDGFALFAAVDDGYMGYKLPYVQYTENGSTFYCQNGYLGLRWVLPTYWRNDLPASRVLMNGTQYTALGIQRRKRQEVEMPALQDPVLLNLVKTGLGNGEIRNLSINLHSRNAKAVLNYDTEEKTYEEVQYLQGTGTQYIDLPIIPDENTGIRIIAEAYDNTDSYAVGLRDTSGNTRWCIGRSSTGWYWGYGTYLSSSDRVTSLSVDAKLNWLNNKKFVAEGGGITKEYNLPTLSFTPVNKIRLFGSSGMSASYSSWKGKQYRVQVSQGLEMIMDLIPVKVGNTGYLFDTMGGGFYGNDGTSDFIIGV